ncbi:hypothetical protein [Hymenobacter algoricola]|uniref:Uncharacterized protein n=1 Tax=Hymenobacter algoricola TaxID=486267 RepID=A0ABP7N3X2_9BACT
MEYSLNLLTTVADCDTLLAKAASDQRVLQHRSDNYDYAREASGETATEIQASLASLDAEISSLNTIIPTLAAGTRARKRNEVELRDAIHARAGLLDRQAARGPVALLSRERDVAETDAQIAEITNFIAVITARRAAL